MKTLAVGFSVSRKPYIKLIDGKVFVSQIITL